MRFAALPILLVGSCLVIGCARSREAQPATVDLSSRPFAFVEGAPVRGDVSQKRIALIFTGGEYGEGASTILDVLAQRKIHAGFFVTGDFVRTREFRPLLRRMVAEGHYLGPHSDSHPLYCPWEDRSETQVTQAFFARDLKKNIDDLRRFGAMREKGKPIYFIPPFEWYNADQTAWASTMGVLLFNFTPGSGSNRDYAPEGTKAFRPSTKLVHDVLAYEQRDPHGLNGFLLLLHLGANRVDKMHPHIGGLIDELTQRGYTFVRVDEMIR